MAAKRVVVVGNGRMAQRCSELLLRSAAADLRLVVAEQRNDAAQSRLARFCDEASVRLLQPKGAINAADVLAALAAERPDIIFSIDNFQIFGDELLEIARYGCINFHNGPIDRYRGVHAPSWAIFNDEKEHGVTWHYMQRRIDAGAIAAEDKIALNGDETALSLTLECIRVGVDAFERALDDILAGRRIRALGTATAKLYRRSDLPDGGVLDLRSTAAHIGRLLRATDFRPFPNPFTYVRLPCPRGALIVNEVEPVGASAGHAAGEIVAADQRLVVACADRLLSLAGVMLQPDEAANVTEVIPALGLRVGQRLLP
jgi:methionyl-tRNA formyltransferase